MKKIMVTNEQMDKINKFVSEEDESINLNEGLMDDRYEQECVIDFNYGSNLTFEGNEVADIESVNMRVTFLIEVEHKSWGIKGISLYDIQGFDEIDLYLDVYEEGDDDFTPTSKRTKLKLEWDGVDVENTTGQGMIGIDQNVELDLENDSEGNIIVSKITVETFTI